MQLLPNEFWSLTWAEYYHMAKGYVRRATLRRNELIYTAWHAEAFARSKVLPNLDSLIQFDYEDTPKVQTEEDMVAMVMLLNAAFGGEVVEVTDGNL